MATRRGLDAKTPNVARIYDYWLGGKDNFAADRATAEKISEIVPEARAAARANREFLGRAVRFLAGEGIRQFIDLGTGLPTQSNVHEVAHQVVPQARVVYVDYDPVVVVHGQALLQAYDATAIVEADLRETEKILEHHELRALIDLDRPVAVLMVGILHFITDAEDPYGIVARFREAVAPGSYLAICHVTADPRPQAEAPVAEIYRETTAPMVPRSHEQVLRLFDGFDLVEPGLVYAPEWRPEWTGEPADPVTSFVLAGVGRKPANP
ncbi:MAG TPA: SAM-dependent methyltransferase [Streptosporangiaceae bacterium]|nr:SAM-dependent methyltransferase [Streptosporangiaceae bacterium]